MFIQLVPEGVCHLRVGEALSPGARGCPGTPAEVPNPIRKQEILHDFLETNQL